MGSTALEPGTAEPRGGSSIARLLELPSIFIVALVEALALVLARRKYQRSQVLEIREFPVEHCIGHKWPTFLSTTLCTAWLIVKDIWQQFLYIGNLR